ncbi:MAG: HAD family hydrolase [Candidatus Adiutrix sp.]|jgi:HAD superfamily hydrolase (TIGR01509 family)|nr:HAD family hydrolase [Candidatus Adiutrix sp.]
MIQTVIFDFDLTLVDSVYAITCGLNKMARHFNLPPVDEDDTRRVMSLEAKDFWFNLWGCYDEAWKDFFIHEVSANEGEHLQLTPGALKLVRRLKSEGLGLALATNRDNAWAALASIGLAQYFDTAVGVADVARGKPAPDMLLMVMDQMQTDPGHSLYIGDAISDMEAAARAGIRGVGILEGGQSREDLIRAGAWQVRENLNDLDDILDLI